MKVVVSALLFLFCTSLAFAGVLVGAPNLNNQSEFVEINNQVFEAAQFTLSSNSFVSSVDVYLSLGSPTLDLYNVALQDALTGTINTFASASFTPTGSFPGGQFTLNVGSVLPAGTYYLVGSESVAQPVGGGFPVSDGTYIQNAGTVTDGQFFSLDSGATWSFQDPSTNIPNFGVCGGLCSAPQFLVNGETVPTSAPEPGSLILLGSGCIAIVMRRRR